MTGRRAAKAPADADRKPFKLWFDRSAAHALGAQVAAAQPGFDEARFVRLATRGLGQLEFADRVCRFADALAATLPDDVPAALDALTRSLPPPLPDCEAVTDGWLQWPVGQFIADHGLPHPDASMAAMVELTQRFSAEFAVRPFVEHRPETTFERLLALTDHPSPHVRRWCSEGVRPRLPWGKRLRALVADPSPIWPILEALKDDPEVYVRRSVANNVNDISRDHRGQVLARCRTWSRRSTPAREHVVRHGLRSLLKAGDREALAVVGFGPPRHVDARLEVEPREIAVGESVTLHARLSTRATRPQRVMIDYVVHYARPDGKTGAKVFKWTTADLPGRGELELRKRHPMRVTTIRALHPGLHRIELQVNGERAAEARFTLA